VVVSFNTVDDIQEFNNDAKLECRGNAVDVDVG
jgi:hypothetical protein